MQPAFRQKALLAEPQNRLMRPSLDIVIITGMDLILTHLTETFTIHRLAASAEIPPFALSSPFFAITRTKDELSLVLPESVEIESDRSEADWSCFKVDGPLEFNLVGVMAGIAGVLAEAGVSIFALSTFDTDYILVKSKQTQAARDALKTAGYQVRHGV